MKIPGTTGTVVPPRRRVAAWLLTVARFGYAHWFSGNLYEAVVNVPELVATAPRVADGPGAPRGVVRRGSPLRYYLPAPVTLAASLAALAAGWDRPSDRRWLGASLACTAAGAAVTVSLVRDVNLKLFLADQPLEGTERNRLLRRWHRWNIVRLFAVGGAWLAAQRVMSARLGTAGRRYLL